MMNIRMVSELRSFFSSAGIVKYALLVLSVSLATMVFLVVYKNISYPLLWNDESFTAMFAQRVLTYGYPKVHDGKNVINLYEGSNVHEAVSSYDGYLFADWAPYYIAAIGEYLARFTSDIYTRTAVLRIPFATLGLLGLGILGYTFLPFLGGGHTRRYFYACLFSLFLLLSVPLILHIRQVVYYPLTIFATACVIYVFVRHTFLRPYRQSYYFIVLTGLLVFFYTVFHPGYFVVIAALGSWIVAAFLVNQLEVHIPRPFLLTQSYFSIVPVTPWRNLLRSLSPLIASLLCILPIALLGNHFSLASTIATEKGFSLGRQAEHIVQQLSFFSIWGFGFLILAVKLFLFIILFVQRGKHGKSIWTRFAASSFLSFFFIVYIVGIARLPYLFERYFINLQPIIGLIVLLDLFLLFDLLTSATSQRIEVTKGSCFILRPPHMIVAAFIALTFVAAMQVRPMLHSVAQYQVEISEPYRGPLDFVIPYIQANFSNTEDLVIATNYEETSLMYYLNAKVIIGYVLNNYKDDMNYSPDIIIIRKGWPDNANALQVLLSRGVYREVRFPVLDYWANNIPDSTTLPSFVHLYKTPLVDTTDPRSLTIYIKQ